jgi:hypothetical protein
LLRNLKMTRADFVLPFIAPTFDGSVLLDWTSENRTLEVQPEGDEWSAVGTILHRDGKREYFSTDGPVNNIEVFYDWFRNGQLLWPTQ